MAQPENSPSNAALLIELANVQSKLERADENENTIERYSQRDELLELSDMLQAEIASSDPTEK
jgi:hypothetical protein